jgi:hypothetical protein
MGAGGYSSAVEHLPSKHEALSSVPRKKIIKGAIPKVIFNVKCLPTSSPTLTMNVYTSP